MPSWLPSIPYPPARDDGYWAPITSTLDWCEEVSLVASNTSTIPTPELTSDEQNYYATPYSAEIVNTLTNLLFVFLAFKGMYSCYKHDHDRIFFVTFAGYLLVGTGSFAFHSTL
ncbi:hypothetical protein KC328_g16816, partial [Hortaea werneckii]